MSIRDPRRLVDVVVVVPARDESLRIATCLRSVRISLQQALIAGAVGHVAVAVVGHHCADDTLGRADRSLAGLPHVLVADDTSATVGDARAQGVRAALDLMPSRQGNAAPREVWILNTDADSVVPSTWVTDVLAHATAGHQAVVGMARLSRAGLGAVGLHHNHGAAAAYRRIIRAGVHGRSHDHVYGANLAVRADAYAAIGEFPSVRVGEDRALVDSLDRDGRPVVRPRDLVVTTSARRHGRAVGGLATLLDTLDRAHQPTRSVDSSPTLTSSRPSRSPASAATSGIPGSSPIG